MAAALSALNAKIRSQPVLNYLCSTHFWGPASNFGIPIAAVMDTQKDPEIISGRMTTALTVYAAVFARYALAVTPKNYLLFTCHIVNFGAQSTQLFRYQRYWYGGGREKSLEDKARSGAAQLREEGKQVVDDAKGLADKMKEKITK